MLNYSVAELRKIRIRIVSKLFLNILSNGRNLILLNEYKIRLSHLLSLAALKIMVVYPPRLLYKRSE